MPPATHVIAVIELAARVAFIARIYRRHELSYAFRRASTILYPFYFSPLRPHFISVLEMKARFEALLTARPRLRSI